MKKKKEKTKFTHVGEFEQIPASDRKLIMLILMYYNEAGSREEGKKLLRRRWVCKIYTLPRPTHHTYNSIKATRSAYWRRLNYIIDKYIVEVAD